MSCPVWAQGQEPPFPARRGGRTGQSTQLAMNSSKESLPALSPLTPHQPRVPLQPPPCSPLPAAPPSPPQGPVRPRTTAQPPLLLFLGAPTPAWTPGPGPASEPAPCAPGLLAIPARRQRGRRCATSPQRRQRRRAGRAGRREGGKGHAVAAPPMWPRPLRLGRHM